MREQTWFTLDLVMCRCVRAESECVIHFYCAFLPQPRRFLCAVKIDLLWLCPIPGRNWNNSWERPSSHKFLLSDFHFINETRAMKFERAVMCQSFVVIKFKRTDLSAAFYCFSYQLRNVFSYLRQITTLRLLIFMVLWTFWIFYGFLDVSTGLRIFFYLKRLILDFPPLKLIFGSPQQVRKS